MARCCAKVSSCVGCLLLLGAIAVIAWPIYSLGYRVPGSFAVQNGTDFNLDITQQMSENNCSFLLLRVGGDDDDACRSANVQVSPPGATGLSGHEWTSIDKAACQVYALHWMQHFQPSLQFLGRLVPISTTYTNLAPRVGEYHVQSDEPLWALNQCEFPLYNYFPIGNGIPAGGIMLVFGAVSSVLGAVAVLTCLGALLVCCCCK